MSPVSPRRSGRRCSRRRAGHRRRDDRRPVARRRRHRRRQDEHACVRLDRVHRQPGFGASATRGTRTAAGWFEWRFGGRARGRSRTTRDDHRRRRIRAHPRVDVRPGRLQAHARRHRARLGRRAGWGSPLPARRARPSPTPCSRCRSSRARPAPTSTNFRRVRRARSRRDPARRRVPDVARRCRPRGRRRVRGDSRPRSRTISAFPVHASTRFSRGRLPMQWFTISSGGARAVDGVVRTTVGRVRTRPDPDVAVTARV